MIKKKKKKKKASNRVEMTLWGVILSYPDLHSPKPFKGKIYYKTDCLLEEDDAQVGKIRAAVKQVKQSAWGTDETEWPECKVLVQKGDTKEDQPAYAGKRFISASTQQSVPVVDGKGKPFSPQMVKGGMFANVAICISAWEFDGDEGISIYLQGVQVDTTKPKLPGFGGGKSVDQMFSKKSGESEEEESEEEESEEEESEEEESEEEESSKSKKKRKSSRNFDEG